MRTMLKRAVMNLYCWNLLPAVAVRFMFRVFRLRSE